MKFLQRVQLRSCEGIQIVLCMWILIHMGTSKIMDNAQGLNGILVKGIHYRTERPIAVTVSNGVIERIEELEPMKNTTLPWIGPGLVELQINGCFGIDFNTPPITVEDIHTATRKLWTEGVTTYYPTVITNSDEEIANMVQVIAEACESDPLTKHSIAGIHIEGPFISPLDGPRGAHGQSFVKEPDWELFERWQLAAGGLIRMLTYHQSGTIRLSLSRVVWTGVVFFWLVL